MDSLAKASSFWLLVIANPHPASQLRPCSLQVSSLPLPNEVPSPARQLSRVCVQDARGGYQPQDTQASPVSQTVDTHTTATLSSPWPASRGHSSRLPAFQVAQIPQAPDLLFLKASNSRTPQSAGPKNLTQAPLGSHCSPGA